MGSLLLLGAVFVYGSACAERTATPPPSSSSTEFTGLDGRTWRVRLDLCCAVNDGSTESPETCGARGPDCRYGPQTYCDGRRPPDEVVERRRLDRERCHTPCECRCAPCGPVP